MQFVNSTFVPIVHKTQYDLITRGCWGQRNLFAKRECVRTRSMEKCEFLWNGINVKRVDYKMGLECAKHVLKSVIPIVKHTLVED